MTTDTNLRVILGRCCMTCQRLDEDFHCRLTENATKVVKVDPVLLFVVICDKYAGANADMLRAELQLLIEAGVEDRIKTEDGEGEMPE